MKTQSIIRLAAFLCLLVAFSRADAQFSYEIADLGTLGGPRLAPTAVAAWSDTARIIVGSSTLKDKSEHAFLYLDGEMHDLNALCDLPKSSFKVLTRANTISDSCVIVGEGITKTGEKHTFLLTPALVDGGCWSYACCRWTWKQDGGWWWDTDSRSYTWHGPR